ncbi:secretin N-terminal domain-containing protein [Novosphingobium pokkalii]|uniref:secretin N-terminal domain-containing protein n=1 Tax=Novosphingobium pokkalii TaxID=1770194 RepID=UPI003639E40C
MVTEIVRLRVAEAAQALDTLRPLVSKDGSLTANKAGNSLVVVDYADNVARIRALVRQIDQDRASVLTLDLAHAGAREVATALTQLVAAGEGGRSPASVVAVDSANAVVLRGDPPTLARLADVARRLDARAGEGGAIRVLWLDHADAALLVPVLERLVGGAGETRARVRRRRFRWAARMALPLRPQPVPRPVLLQARREALSAAWAAGRSGLTAGAARRRSPAIPVPMR